MKIFNLEFSTRTMVEAVTGILSLSACAALSHSNAKKDKENSQLKGENKVLREENEKKDRKVNIMIYSAGKRQAELEEERRKRQTN